MVTENIICVSGGFDPIHSGHLKMFQEAAAHGKLHVVVNSDDWLLRKKGFIFQNWKERAELISAIRWVSQIEKVDDSDDTVCEALKRIKPKYFANGGDRKQQNTPELETCKEFNIKSLWTVGGEKTESSSQISLRAAVNRPWGQYRVLAEYEGYKVKQLTVYPNEKISLQYHIHRNEHWTVVRGRATVRIGNETTQLFPHQSIDVPRKALHQLSNDHTEPLVIIETQIGPYLGEDDIVRIEDKYGRI